MSARVCFHRTRPLHVRYFDRPIRSVMGPTRTDFSDRKFGRKREQEQQYSRKNSLRIFGLTEERNENLKMKVLSFLHSCMDVSLTQHEINTCYRTGELRDISKPRPILVKFRSHLHRDLILRKRKSLRGSMITIQEDLPKEQMLLLQAAKCELGRHNVWSSDGNVLSMLRGSVVRIESVDDLKKWEEPINPPPDRNQPSVSISLGSQDGNVYVSRDIEESFSEHWYGQPLVSTSLENYYAPRPDIDESFTKQWYGVTQ